MHAEVKKNLDRQIGIPPHIVAGCGGGVIGGKGEEEEEAAAGEGEERERER